LPGLKQALYGSGTQDYKTAAVAGFDTVNPIDKPEKPTETIFATLLLLWLSNKIVGTKRD
jgi:hypothetical protein